jgi:hypothetical protein
VVRQTYFEAGFWYGFVAGVAASAVLWLWLTLARAAGALATRRGYPRIAGLALGLVAGPVAIATFALLPTRRHGDAGL